MIKSTIKPIFSLSIAFILSATTNLYAGTTIPLRVSNMANVLASIEKNPTFWPGLDITKRPIVIQEWGSTTSDNGLYAFYLTPKNKAWKPLSINEKSANFTTDDIYGVGDFSATMEMPFLDIDGQLSFIANQGLGLEEEFHMDTIMGLTYRIIAFSTSETLDAASKQAFISQYANYDYSVELKNPGRVSLQYLESLLLMSYLQDPKEDKLKDLAAVNAIRKTAIHLPAIEKSENIYDSFISVYEYVSHQVYVSLDGNEKHYSDMMSKRKLDYIKITSDSIGDNDKYDFVGDVENMTTYNTYVATYAIETIHLENWKNNLDFTKNNVIDLLAQHYQLSEKEIALRVVAVKLQYNYDRIYQNVVKNLKDHPDGGNAGRSVVSNKLLFNQLQKQLQRLTVK